jgi:hypothetical protein
MPRPPRFFAPLLLGLAALAASPASLGDEAENLRQLLAMPRERRIALSENLERFDKLDPAERAAIRKLEAQIARKNPVEQARYRSVLRRYHLWVNNLSDEEKAQLKATEGAEARFNLARKFRLKELEGGATGPRVFGIRTGDYGLIGPYEAAHLLKIWKLLTPARRLEIERQRERGVILREILGYQGSVGVAFQPFPAAEEKRLDAKLEADEVFKKQLGPILARRPEANPKKAEAVAKGAFLRPNQVRFAEFLYFEEPEHKPKAVSRRNIERFAASCPNWLREMIDPLSPDDARAYLTIVYRLLYPEPGEMPAEARPAKPSAESKPPAAKPGEGKSRPAGPF